MGVDLTERCGRPERAVCAFDGCLRGSLQRASRPAGSLPRHEHQVIRFASSTLFHRHRRPALVRRRSPRRCPHPFVASLSPLTGVPSLRASRWQAVGLKLITDDSSGPCSVDGPPGRGQERPQEGARGLARAQRRWQGQSLRSSSRLSVRSICSSWACPLKGAELGPAFAWLALGERDHRASEPGKRRSEMALTSSNSRRCTPSERCPIASIRVIPSLAQPSQGFRLLSDSPALTRSPAPPSPLVPPSRTSFPLRPSTNPM